MFPQGTGGQAPAADVEDTTSAWRPTDDPTTDPTANPATAAAPAPTTSISTAEDATTAIRNAANALDASLFAGKGACEPTGEYLHRAVTAALGSRSGRSSSITPRRSVVYFQLTRVLSLAFCLAAVVQVALSASLLLSRVARARLDLPHLPVIAITTTGAALGVGAWLTWRALVIGLASLADTDWPTKSSADPADHHGGGVWTMLSAAVIAAVGGLVVCCSLPGRAADEDGGEDHGDEKPSPLGAAVCADRWGGLGLTTTGAHPPLGDGRGNAKRHEYALTGIESGGSSSAQSATRMLVDIASPGSPRAVPGGKIPGGYFRRHR